MKKLKIMLAASLIAVFAISANLSAMAVISKDGSPVEQKVKGPDEITILKTPLSVVPVPSKYVSRVEFLAMIHGTLDLKLRYFAAPNIEGIFKDMKNSDKYADQMYDLYTIGVIDDKNKLRPNSKIKQEEAIHYLIKAYKYGLDNNVFKGKWDIDEQWVAPRIKLVKKDYSESVEKAQYLEFIDFNGKGFGPKRLVTREQADAFIKKLENAKVSGNTQQNVIVEPSYKHLDNGLELKAVVRNNSKEEVAINFNSGEKFRFILTDGDGHEVFNSSKGMMFTQALSKLVLKPGETKEFIKTLTSNRYKEVLDKAVFFKVAIPGRLDNGEMIEEQTTKLVRFLGPPVKKIAPTIDAIPSAKLTAQGLEMSVDLTNITERKVDVEHSTGILYDFVLLDTNKKEVYRSSAGKMFIEMMTSTTFEPGEKKNFKEVLDYSKNKEVVDNARFLKVEVSGWITGNKLVSPEEVEVQ